MKKNSTLFLSLGLVLFALIMALGGWWLYLLSQFGEFLQGSGQSEQGQRLIQMIKWEGGTFVAVLLVLMGALIALYLRDQKKSASLAAFYAGMTHELKTPLASIRLQAEVLQDLQDLKETDGKRQTEIQRRLIESCKKLETQMDKILQLGRIEGGGCFNVRPLPLIETIQTAHKCWAPELNLEIHTELSKAQTQVSADPLALDLILRNLFENTLNHSKNSHAKMDITRQAGQIMLSYLDGGSFAGNPQKLGTLFYKFNSPKGSGIGLYLIKKLAGQMHGHFNIQHSPLAFQLQLPGGGHA